MKFFRLLIAMVGLAGTIWAMTASHTIKGKSLPPLAGFFNPFSGFWKNAEEVSPSKSEADFQLPGLKGNVSVVFDDLAIPHIFAENLADALMVQGYVTARDRLFQMDISSRKSAGRLSELVGERTIPVDIATNHRGTPKAAELGVVALKKSTDYPLMQAYVAGVNAYISQLTPEQWPIEYKLMNSQPELWSDYHTACVVEGMAESLVNRSEDIANAANKAILGEDMYKLLFPRYNPEQTPIVPDDGQWKGIAPYDPAKHQATKTNAGAQGVGAIFPEGQQKDEWTSWEPKDLKNAKYQVMNGSNNWAINGSKTASQKPMLANDPHLSLTLPSIWYQVQIHTPEMNVYGVSLPGVPGVIIGFNEDIAWGVTNVSHDVGDYFKIKWANAEKTAYYLDGEVKQADLIVQKIVVKGKPEPVLDTIRYTHFGPVASIDQTSANCDLAFKWMPQLEPSSELIGFLKLNQAKSYDEYRRSIREFDSPAQNFVFASRTGDIGITVQGKYPLRSAATAEFIQDGSTIANDWQGFIPADHIPFQKNPSRGFVFSANQHSTPPSYPYPYYGYFDDYRGRSIHKQLTALRNANQDSMAAIQLDSRTLLVNDALPTMMALLDTASLDAVSRSHLDQLKAWDGRFAKEAVPPVLFDLWYNELYDRVFADFQSRLDEGKPVTMPETFQLNNLMKTNPKHAIFDLKTTKEKETAQIHAQAAFQKAIAEYTTLATTNKGVWGLYRGMTINHIARIPAFGREVLCDGHPNAPNANKNGHGPSWRMIVDLQDSITAVGVFPGGQSGNPGSQHYDDMLQTWADGRYFELLFLKDPNQKHERIKFTQKFAKS